MIKRIIDFFRRLYIKLFCDVASEQVNGYWVQARQNGKSITATKAFIWQCIKAEYPRIYHLGNYASKMKTRKKNRLRLAKMLWEVMNG